jgi:DNA-binding transcriptional LysR family regulator
MRLDWLESFVAFAETLNFTRAAERVHLSQPALHVQIRKLGEDLGATLYRRDGRVLALTEDGRRVEALARSLLDQISDLRHGLRRERERAPIVVSAGRATHLHVLSGPLRTWLAEAPRGVRVRAESREETVRALRSGRAHVGVAPLEPPPPTLEARPMLTVPTLLVVPVGHRLARRRRLRVRDLDGCRLILPPVDRPHHARVLAAVAEAGITVEIAIEAGDGSSWRRTRAWGWVWRR